MRSFALAVSLAVLGGCRLALAQTCYGTGDNSPGGVSEFNNFRLVLTVKPGSDEPACHAAVIAPDGKAIFEVEDTGIVVSPGTGSDINGDGFPDAVIEANSGGAHCCLTYFFVSLSNIPEVKPGLLAKIDAGNGSVEVADLNHDNRPEITLYDDSFAYWDGMSFAFSPMPRLVLHLDGTRFSDVSFQFTQDFDKEISEWTAEMTPTELAAFYAQRGNELQLETTKGRAASVVLAYLYSARPAKAWESLDRMWPPPEKARVRDEMRAKYCATLAKLLPTVTAVVCQPDYNYQ